MRPEVGHHHIRPDHVGHEEFLKPVLPVLEFAFFIVIQTSVVDDVVWYPTFEFADGIHYGKRKGDIHTLPPGPRLHIVAHLRQLGAQPKAYP